MALPNNGQVYVPSDADEIRTAYLNDVLSLSTQANQPNPAVQPGTLPYIEATALANVALGLYYNCAILADASSELTATGTDLDAIRQAMGLPELLPAPASGTLVVGTVGSTPVSFVDGTQFTLPNGLRGKVNGNQYVTNGQSLNVIMIDTGTASNALAGTMVKWVSPPVNAAATATVGIDGLTGGTDAETDDQKRSRIIARRQNVPGGGNWAFVQSTATAVSAGIQSAFVYPTLGGPSTLKCALCKAMTLSGTVDYSRQVSATLVSLVTDALRQNMPDSIKIVVQSVADEYTDVALQLSIPSSGTIGGGGNGWIDSVQFPTLVNADNGFVTVTHITSYVHITISAQQSLTPIAGQTIMWWDHSGKTFLNSHIVSFSGSAGAWDLILDTPLRGASNNVTVGDFISPACVFANDYAQTLLTSFNTMGPGENTSDPVRLARAARKPNVGKGASSYPTDVGALQLSAVVDSRDEITDAAYSYRSKSTPTVPASIDDAPNLLNLNNLAFYPI